MATDLRLELVILPVDDVDAARDFYADKCGFVVDHDQRVNERLRFVQLTPPGSACSIAIGEGITDAVPGTVKGLQLVTDDADATRADFLARGLDVGEVDEQPWGRFVYFTDPSGNSWAVQQIVRPGTG